MAKRRLVENPEWTAEDIKRAVRLKDMPGEMLSEKLAAVRRRGPLREARAPRSRPARKKAAC